MTVRDTQRAIEPGSLRQGDRATLEEGISQVLPQESGPPADAPAGPSGPLGIPEEPLGALLNGEIGGDDLPTTDGLSVGPGAGPDVPLSPQMASPKAQKVRELATQSSSPSLRAAARNELRRMSRNPI